MTPGSNLFLRAMRLIRPTTVQYYAFSARTQNAARQWVPAYAAAVPLEASVQAVSRNSYQNLGLDFQKNYIRMFVAADVVDIARDTSGDRVVFNGRLYQFESQTSWFFTDGWVGILAIDVGPSSGAKF